MSGHVAIEVSQFNEQYSGKDPKVFDHAPELYRWKVTFAELRDVFVTERNLGARAGGKKPLVICAVRFKCSRVIGVENNRLPDMDKPPDVMADEDDDNPEQGGDEIKEDEPPVHNDFPLAALASDAEGKEFRIAVVKTNADFGGGRSNPYGWAWPGVVRFLAGLEFSHNVKEDFTEPLDVWAERNKNLLRTVKLVEILPRDGMATREWALQKVLLDLPKLVFPPLPPGMSLRLPSKPLAVIPSPSTSVIPDPPAQIPLTTPGSPAKAIREETDEEVREAARSFKKRRLG
ncbi:MAG: hypothetical protein Q9169_004751 [Polycauliona sp. 2 TL-2023]